MSASETIIWGLYYVSATVYVAKSAYSLYRTTPNGLKIKLPPIIKEAHKELKISKQIDEEYINDINKYYRILKRRLPDEYLNTFKNNIESANIKKVKHFYQESTAGEYSCKKNEISLGYKKDVITHELFHLSSSILKDKSIYSGFYQIHKKIDIGIGLNEGYTSLLDYRYFNVNPVYILEYIHSSLLEDIIGKSKMEKYYFTSNLYGIVEELKKYTPKRKIIQFLQKLDYIKENRNNEKKYSKCQKYTTENILFLLKCQLLKYKTNLKYPISDNYYYNICNNINYTIDNLTDYTRKGYEYIDEIKGYKKIKNYIHKLVELQDCYRLLDDIFNNNKINNLIDSGKLDERYLYTRQLDPNKLTYKIKSR